MTVPLVSASMSPAGTVPPRLAEVRVDSLAPYLDFEHVEIAAPAGADLSGYSIVVIGDDDESIGPALGNSGVVEAVIPLAGVAVPMDHAMLVDAGTGPVAPDLVWDLHLEDVDNLTVLLVRGASVAVGEDLDTNDDGSLDDPPWKETVDGVALVWNAPGVLSEQVYSDRWVGPLDTDVWWPLANTYPDPLESPGSLNAPGQGYLCLGDLDLDGSVGPGDLAAILSHWGMVGAIGDVDRNGRVEAADLAMLLGRWGPCDL